MGLGEIARLRSNLDLFPDLVWLAVSFSVHGNHPTTSHHITPDHRAKKNPTCWGGVCIVCLPSENGGRQIWPQRGDTFELIHAHGSGQRV